MTGGVGFTPHRVCRRLLRKGCVAVPIYEFHCAACGAEFERIQSFSDESTPACPQCESHEVTRQLGRPAIHFKGSGWYITDSKKSSGESANGNGNGNGRTDEKSDGQKSDEKVATSDAKGDATAKADTTDKSSEKKTETAKASTPSSD